MDFNTVARVMLGIIGLVLSIYTIHVEIQAHADKSYKAMCDINEHVSCTKVFMSKYGRGFGLVEPVLGKDSFLNIPNPIFGVLFYGMVIVLSLTRHSQKVMKALTILAGISCIMSVYLATILYKLQDTCVVCISTYLVNFLLLFLSFKRYNELIVVEKYKAE